MPSASEGAISYITVSLAYHAIVYPVSYPLYESDSIRGWFWLGWLTLIFLAPALLGILLGLNIRRGWTKFLVNRIGINTIHPINCAWDWRFGNCTECWVILTLKDDTKWYGFIGEGSFISSDATERDIFIESVYDFSVEGQPWTPRNTSVWIANGELQSVEFLPR